MGLDIEVKVSLEEHREHSVIVSVLLSPKEGPTAVDGVALRLRDVRGEGLGPRVLLPIAGTLAQAMRTTVALAPEADDGVPPGANVQVVAWRGEEQCEAVLPTDPMTALEMHARGTSIWPVTEPTQLLEPLSAADRARWVALYPWLDEPRLPCLLYTSPSPRDGLLSRMPSSA